MSQTSGELGIALGVGLNVAASIGAASFRVLAVVMVRTLRDLPPSGDTQPQAHESEPQFAGQER